MNIRMAAIAAASIFAASAAFAAKLPANVSNAEECKQLIDVTNQTVTEQSDIGEKARQKVAELVTKIDGECKSGDFAAAEVTASEIRGLVATE